MPWGVPARGNSDPLIPPKYSDRRTLAVDTFIDIVGQNWSGYTKLCTPLQHTVSYTGEPTSEVVTAIPDSMVQRKKLHLQPDKEAFSGNTVRGQENIHFSCSADHEQNWQPYLVDPYSAICDDHTYIHTYITSCRHYSSW